MSQKRPLMGTENILELQDNGYKSTVSAIAEIVDNSIQADSKNVDIVVVRNTTRDHDEIDEILIIDDGSGMDKEVFDKALQMSSGTRSKAKHGLGKYGQGLPNSSISQTKRVEVYTLQDNEILFNYIDLEEIYESGEAFLPEIESKGLIDIPIVQAEKVNIPNSGTIVRWVKPNRVKPKTAKTLSSHIEQVAGRMFKYYLNGFTDKDGKKYKTKINILVFDYNGSNYEVDNFCTKRKIAPFDPMFLMPKTQMNSLFPDSSHPTSELFPHSCKKTFTVEHNGEIVNTEVEIILSYCKKDERNRYGSSPGSTSFGKKYLKRNSFKSGYNNISIIRAGREIDSGMFGFITDVSDPTHRWWSAEICVDPVLDSIIGIDNKKQQASNIHFLDAEELSDVDTHEIIRWISTFLYENIKSVKKKIDEQNAGSRGGGADGSGGGKLPPGGVSEPGTDPTVICPDPDPDPEDETRKKLFEWIKERYPDLSDEEVNEIVDHALSIRDHHIFIKSDLGDTQLYSYQVFGTKVLIEINYSHNFYKKFMQKFEDDDKYDKSLRSVRLLIGSMVNAELINKTEDKTLIKDRRNIRNRMAESLDDYIEDLYSS